MSENAPTSRRAAREARRAQDQGAAAPAGEDRTIRRPAAPAAPPQPSTPPAQPSGSPGPADGARPSSSRPPRGARRPDKARRQGKAPRPGKATRPARAAGAEAKGAPLDGLRTVAARPVSLLRQAWRVIVDVCGPVTGRVRDVLVRTVGPVVSVVTPLGWACLALVLCMAWFATAFGWQEATALGILLGVLLVVGCAFIVGRSSYQVTLDLTRTRVAVGDNAVGGISVINTAPRPVMHSTLELPVGRAVASFPIPRLRPQELHEDLFSIPTNRRQVIMVGPAVSVRADPFHLLKRQIRWTEPVELFVHPRTVALGSPAAGFIRDLEGMTTKELSNTDVSFHALREYAPGDDRRHIHWKTVARLGTLMVRQFEETRRAHLAIALSANLDEYASELEFELAISVACSVGRQALVEQRELDILTQRGPFRCATGRTMLDDATRLQSMTGRRDAVDLARRLADRVPNASVVFFVVGSGVTPAQLRSCAASVLPGVRAMAIRIQPGAAPSRATIADLTVLTLGGLDDLALVLRKAVA
ncbi:DUF58 domain-containing protein [Arthrobacter woluwensis]|uniref:DUF58 domain-containing protein n=1 Tax=Arthrobacter woluwensis TaxID=156980 RepID=UPI00312C8879